MDEPDDLPPAETEAQVRTGVARVDRVIQAVEHLEERPIEEHVGVFETAHDELRRCLDADPDVDPDAGSDGRAPSDAPA